MDGHRATAYRIPLTGPLTTHQAADQAKRPRTRPDQCPAVSSESVQDPQDPTTMDRTITFGMPSRSRGNVSAAEPGASTTVNCGRSIGDNATAGTPRRSGIQCAYSRDSVSIVSPRCPATLPAVGAD